jgi:hypothetical protein
MVMREIVKARKEIPGGGMKNLQYEKEGKDRFTGGKKRRNLFRIEEKKKVWKRLLNGYGCEVKNWFWRRIWDMGLDRKEPDHK